MEIRSALKSQYHAGLDMLGQCCDRCPDDLWASGTYPRYFWRIAFHTAFFAHLYLGQTLADFKPWPARREGIHPDLWEDPATVDPYDLQRDADRYTQAEMRAYVDFVDAMVDSAVDGLDLDTSDSGFEWYPKTSKLAHQILNIRHIGNHAGQLSELLMARGIDLDWVGEPKPRS